MRKIFIISCLSFLFCLNSQAAPIPGTSSSSFLKADMGMFRSPKGFLIHAGKTSWIQVEAPKGNKYIQTIYKAPYKNEGIQAALTVRVDQLHKEYSVKKYMKKWLKEYPRLGFKVLNSQKVKVGSKIGFLIDLADSESQKQLRQVVFVKGYMAIIMTCRDHKSSFKSTIKSCNQIVKNFSWL